MKIAILGAMAEEIAPILAAHPHTEREHAGNRFYEIDLASAQLIVAHSKIGKVNAALTATIMCEKFGAEYLIFTGVAGSLNPALKIGEMLCASELCQHDVDITAFGHAPGYVPDTPRMIATSERLGKIAEKCARELGIKLAFGRIATADQFVCEHERKEWIRQTFGADAVEMEGASVALVCAQLGVPCCVLRSISDDAAGEATASFDEFLELAANNSARLAMAMVAKLARPQLSKRLIREVARACDKFNLIEPNDRVLVGLSGGKDSIALVLLLAHMQRAVPFKFHFEAATLSYGMGEDYSHLSNFCAAIGVPHRVIESNIYEISGEKIRQNSSFCSFFSRMRRGYLYTAAREGGFNKLALGHHLDDAAESFVMNFSYNGMLRSMAPKYKSEQGVTVIRPLILVRERMLRENALKNGLRTIGDEACPAMRFDIKMPHARAEAKELLASLEAANPRLFKSLKQAFMNIHVESFFTSGKIDAAAVCEDDGCSCGN